MGRNQKIRKNRKSNSASTSKGFGEYQPKKEDLFQEFVYNLLHIAHSHDVHSGEMPLTIGDPFQVSVVEDKPELLEAVKAYLCQDVRPSVGSSIVLYSHPRSAIGKSTDENVSIVGKYDWVLTVQNGSVLVSESHPSEQVIDVDAAVEQFQESLVGLTDEGKFNTIYDVHLTPGMRLEILDKTDWDVYDCTVTRIANGAIYVKRDDRKTEELADVTCLQTPGDEDETDFIYC